MFLLKKAIKFLKCFRWSTIFAIFVYFVFIALLLNWAMSSNDSSNSRSLKKISKTLHSLNNMSNKTDNQQIPDTVILSSSLNEKNILKLAFDRANTDKDEFLTIQELAKYINQKIWDHTHRSINQNPIIFSLIDLSPKDGLITWEEYHSFFLKEHGMDEEYIKEHNEAKHIKLNSKAKEDMMRDKSRWAEASKTDPFSLTIDEFLAFQHPESSTSNLLGLVDDLLRLFDIDGDDRLTIEEFSDVTVDEEDEKYRKSVISKTVEERQAEFTHIIDQNKDGKADRGELLAYVNPRHPRYAVKEAATLVSLTDKNKDNQLSFEEILANSKIFMTSKMIATANSFHEEF